MDSTFDRLQGCVRQGIISPLQAQQLADALPEDITPSARERDLSGLTKTLYYLGGFLIVFAVTYFLGWNWEQLTHAERIGISLALSVGFGAWGAYTQRSPYRVGAGLLLLASTACIPLFIYSVEKATDLWPAPITESFGSFLGTVNSAWVILDVSSLAAACLMFRVFREPLLTLPISHFFWFLALDGADWLHEGTADSFMASLHYRTQITILAGGILIAWGIWYSARRDARVGVWPWIYGLSMVLGGLTVMRWEDYGSTYTWITCQLIFSLACLFIAPSLRSRTFTTFGAIGLFVYLQDVYYTYYLGSLRFSVTLGAVGVACIILGMLLQWNARQGEERAPASRAMHID